MPYLDTNWPSFFQELGISHNVAMAYCWGFIMGLSLNVPCLIAQLLKRLLSEGTHIDKEAIDVSED